jgi:hypothetical protein
MLLAVLTLNLQGQSLNSHTSFNSSVGLFLSVGGKTFRIFSNFLANHISYKIRDHSRIVKKQSGAV